MDTYIAITNKLSSRNMQVRPFNMAEHKVIRDLNPDDMNKLISVSGMITRSSSIIPDPRYQTPKHVQTALCEASMSVSKSAECVLPDFLLQHC